MATDFHEVRFPLDLALGSRGGPGRRTDIVTLASGREHRNARFAQSRRRYDAGLGIRTLDALHAFLVFFEERRGRLFGFRFHDRVDHRSGPPSVPVSPLDQAIGTGDGARTSFPLVKRYGAGEGGYVRPIAKPVAGTVRVALDGVEQAPGSGCDCDPTIGLVTFLAPPPAGAAITAGFAFDVPVRFDTDELELDLSAFEAGRDPQSSADRDRALTEAGRKGCSPARPTTRTAVIPGLVPGTSIRLAAPLRSRWPGRARP